MKTIPVRRVSARRLKNFLKEGSWIEDKVAAQGTFERSIGTHTVYKHTDGRILLAMGTVGRLFNTVEEFRAFRDEHERLTKNMHIPSHVLEGIFPYGQDFVEAVPALIEKLGVKLKIPSEQLDYSEDSLLKMDNAIRRYGKKRSLSPEVFPAIVAYCGEVIRRHIDGKWVMLPAQGFEGIWEPWIVKDDRYYNSFLWPYDELYEQSPFSIAGSITVKMKGRGEPKPGSPRQGTSVLTSVAFVNRDIAIGKKSTGDHQTTSDEPKSSEDNH